MIKKCHWALAAVNFKNTDRVVMCPRMQKSLHSLKTAVQPSEFYNNPNFKKLRKDLAQGNWPEEQYCRSCEEYENKDYLSYRQRSLQGKWHDKLYDYFNSKTGKMKYEGLEYIELRFSNACNLNCLHCSPEYSSKWQSVVKDIPVSKKDKEYNIHNLNIDVKNQSWTLDQVDLLTDDLIFNFPNLKYIDVGGGEPLYQKQFWRFLENIQRHPNIENMQILTISNFNTPVDYEKLSKLFLKFRQSEIRISFDGGKNMYKYFRNGKYENILRNINEFRKHNTITTLWATNTISIYQILDIDNIIKDFLDAPVDGLHHSFVQYPEYLSMSVLPSTKELHTLMWKWKNYIDTNFKTMPRLKRIGLTKMVDDIMYMTKKTAIDPEMQKRFVYFTNRMDDIKGTNFQDVYGKTVEELIYG